MTREGIASYLGLELETMSRALSRFRAQGLIKAQLRSVTIADVSRLRALVRDLSQQSRRLLSNPKETTMKILLAVDGSAAADRAATKLVESLAWYAVPPEVDVITVHLPVPRVGGMHRVVSETQIDSYYADECARALESVVGILDAAGVSYRTHTAIGQPAQVIVERARQLGSDLICMGTRGHGAVGTMVLGSVARDVVSQSPVPVTLVH
jgi:nucleotide-binding universal stress UspA family protein